MRLTEDIFTSIFSPLLQIGVNLHSQQNPPPHFLFRVESQCAAVTLGEVTASIISWDLRLVQTISNPRQHNTRDKQRYIRDQPCLKHRSPGGCRCYANAELNLHVSRKVHLSGHELKRDNSVNSDGSWGEQSVSILQTDESTLNLNFNWSEVGSGATVLDLPCDSSPDTPGAGGRKRVESGAENTALNQQHTNCCSSLLLSSKQRVSTGGVTWSRMVIQLPLSSSGNFSRNMKHLFKIFG